MLGTPSDDEIEAMNPDFKAGEFDVPDVKKKHWRDVNLHEI